MQRRRNKPSRPRQPTADAARQPPAARRHRRRLWALIAVLATLLAFAPLLHRALNRADNVVIEQAARTLARDPVEAERLLREILNERTATDARVLSLLSESLARQGRWDESLDVAELWTRSDPNDPAAWQMVSRIQQTQMNVVPASESLRRAIEVAEEPDLRSQLRRELVELLIQAEDAAAAREQVDLLTAAGANQQVSPLQYAYLLRLEGNSDEALELVEQTLAQQPNSVAATMLSGVIHLDRNEFDRAIEALNRVVRLQPTNKEAHYKLALALRSRGQVELAERHFEISRRLVENSTEINTLQTQIFADPNNASLRRRLDELLGAANATTGKQ